MIEKEVVKKYEDLVFSSKLDEAVELLFRYEQETNRDRVIGFLIGMAPVEYIGMLVYQTALLMSRKDKRYLYACCIILSYPLCHFDGAIETAVYHIKKLCNEYPNELKYWKIYSDTIYQAHTTPDKDELEIIEQKIKDLS